MDFIPENNAFFLQMKSETLPREESLKRHEVSLAGRALAS
jgi:hypothetical protein